jgi:hypothetical protein
VIQRLLAALDFESVPSWGQRWLAGVVVMIVTVVSLLVDNWTLVRAAICGCWTMLVFVAFLGIAYMAEDDASSASRMG